MPYVCHMFDQRRDDDRTLAASLKTVRKVYTGHRSRLARERSVECLGFKLRTLPICLDLIKGHPRFTMADLLTLNKILSLPSTPRAFTAHRSSVIESAFDHAHPHKTPRLVHDSDSGSAYRSRDLKGKAVERNGPVRIQVYGVPMRKSVGDSRFSSVTTSVAAKVPNKGPALHFPLLRCCTRFLLTRGSQTEMLPGTFEGVYTACCSLVRVPGQGEKLYEMLVMEIDQCNVRLLRELEAARDTANLTDWLAQFVQVCEWFESRVVRLDRAMHFMTRLTSSFVFRPSCSPCWLISIAHLSQSTRIVKVFGQWLDVLCASTVIADIF